jgi:hypothetical protein
MTEKQALHMWHYYNGDHDRNDTEDDYDDDNGDYLDSQSDIDEEPQPDPYY